MFRFLSHVSLTVLVKEPSGLFEGARLTLQHKALKNPIENNTCAS